LLDTFANALSTSNFLDALSRKLGPNKFPSRFSYFSLVSGFSEGLILDQSTFFSPHSLSGTYYPLFIMPFVPERLYLPLLGWHQDFAGLTTGK